MKLLRYTHNENTALGIILGANEEIIPFSRIPEIATISDMNLAIEALTEEKIAQVKDYVKSNNIVPLMLSEVKLLSPIKRAPHDIICVGLNYKDHIEECERTSDMKECEEIVFFSKRAHYIYGSGEEIPEVYKYDSYFDYEVELAVIIGKEGRDIPPEKVEEYIFGYSVFNDLSARRLQKAHRQWMRGKGLDGLSAMGPWIVHKSEINYPPKLAVSTKVNGEIRQSSNTELFINDIAAIISKFSEGTTLEAGDIIITGTPAGVALGLGVDYYLKSGDSVECAVEGIGSLFNTVK